VYFSRNFDDSPTGAQLYQIYNELYKSAKEAVDRFIAANPGQLDLHATDDGDLPISYNLAMTTNGMVLLPRRSEGTMLRHQDGTEIGFVALNGTTLGGTMLVKNQGEWDTLRAQPEMLDSILAAIGIPKEQDQCRARV
jgi:ATP adenylyltransferase